MKRTLTLVMIVTAMVFALACGGEDKDAASDAAATAPESLGEAVDHASDAADSMAESVEDVAAEAAVVVDAVAACRGFAESGDWAQALDVCTKAHELMPDDLALEHALQQAQAAAGN